MATFRLIGTFPPPLLFSLRRLPDYRIVYVASYLRNLKARLVDSGRVFSLRSA